MLWRSHRGLGLAVALAFCAPVLTGSEAAHGLFLRSAANRVKGAVKRALSRAMKAIKKAGLKGADKVRAIAKAVQQVSTAWKRVADSLKRGIDWAKKKVADLKRLARLFGKTGKKHFITLPLGGKAHRIPLLSLSKLGAKPSAAIQRLAARFQRSVAPAIGQKALSALKEKVDLRKGFGPIRNQWSRGTCVAHATAAVMEYAFQRKPRNLSEQYIYWLFKQNDTTPCDEGYSTSSAPAVVAANGVPTESDWRYKWLDLANKKRKDCKDRETYGTPPSRATKGAKYVITSYTAIANVKDPTEVMKVLDAGYPVAIGFGMAGSGWGWWKQLLGKVIDVEKDKSGQPLPPNGGHAVVLVGYDMDKQAFRLRNSWSALWGRGGYGWVSFDYLRTYAKSGWYINSVGTK